MTATNLYGIEPITPNPYRAERAQFREFLTEQNRIRKEFRSKVKELGLVVEGFRSEAAATKNLVAIQEKSGFPTRTYTYCYI